MRRPPFELICLCLLIVGFGFGLWRWESRPRIRCDEVRVFQLLPSGKPTRNVLVWLRGDAAQTAANNFNFSPSAMYHECLDSRGWFRIMFSSNHRNGGQIFDVYLPNGQMNGNERDISGTKHLSENSRRYWEQLVKAKG